MAKWFTKFALVLLAGLLVSVLTTSNLQAAGENSTTFRLINAAFDEGSTVDLYVDGNKVFENVAFTSVTGIRELAPGNHVLRIVSTGQPFEANPIIPELTLTFDATRDYTLVLMGRSNVANQPLQLLRFEDNLTPTPAGMARVYIVHASPGAPNVDVCIVAQAQCFTNNLGYTSRSETLLPAGSYSVEVRQAGSPDAIFAVPASNFVDGEVYYAVAMGLLAGGNPPLRIQYAPPIQSREPVIAPPIIPNPPVYPPATGAILSPTAAGILGGIILLLCTTLGLGVWAIRRQRV